MTFIWPEMLYLLAAVPVVIALYLFLLRRKRKSAARFANLAMFKDAMDGAASVRRHLPPALLVLALVAMIVAIARPAAVVMLPSSHETVILAMDTSGSMRAADIEPSRLVAAQNAAKAFINDQPKSTRIGIVAFAGTAQVVQPPTRTREDLIAAIDRFQLQRGTAVGSAILISLATLFPEAGIDVTQFTNARDALKAAPIDPWRRSTREEWKPVPPGSNGTAAIILLTDGQRTAGPDTFEAAKVAADRGVRVYTVGIGTPQGVVLATEGMQMRVKLDEDSLKKIASITHAEYFNAGSAADLKKVYQSLTSRLTLEKRQQEVTALFSAAAALLGFLAAMLSMLWYNRIL